MLRRMVVLLAMVQFNVTQNLDAAKNIPKRAVCQRLIHIIEVAMNNLDAEQLHLHHDPQLSLSLYLNKIETPKFFYIIPRVVNHHVHKCMCDIYYTKFFINFV
ncbi:uncharacterized protein DS421_8g241050 [Arachis hypogaea]|nr:uncharacterized protein DS421_8g241050 [Arachis hypogaea]